MDPAKLSEITSIISATQKTMDEIVTEFSSSFLKIDHFENGYALYLLLDEDILENDQRIIALYLLNRMYNEDTVNNPFFEIFIQVYKNSNDLVEKNVVGFMLEKNTAMMRNMSIVLMRQNFNHEMPVVDFEALIQSYKEHILDRVDIVPPLSNLEIPPRVYVHPRNDDVEFNKMDDFTGEDINFSGFGISYTRPLPPLFRSVREDEVYWLHDDILQYDVMWDFSMCMGTTSTPLVREYLAKSFNSVLLAPQLRQVLAELSSNPDLVLYCGISPTKLPNLVTNNPLIAIHVLINLMKSGDISEYLEALLSMDINMNSMEVVNRLSTMVELSPQFIRLYISKCIESCKTIRDKTLQTRLVRLVCVFLQSLIRNKIVNVKDLFGEVQQFCIEFGKIREASALFRLLKQLEE